MSRRKGKKSVSEFFVYELKVVGADGQEASYIGQTNSIEKRQNQHETNLKKKKHHTVKLQKFYDEVTKEGKEATVTLTPITKFSRKEEAFAFEAKTIELMSKKGVPILNTAGTVEDREKKSRTAKRAQAKKRVRNDAKRAKLDRVNRGKTYREAKARKDRYAEMREAKKARKEQEYKTQVENIVLLEEAGIDTGANIPTALKELWVKDIKAKPVREFVEVKNPAVVIKGIKYDSIKKAASNLNIKEDEINFRIKHKHPKYKHYNYATTLPNNKEVDYSLVFSVDGVFMMSIKAISDKYGVSPLEVKRRIYGKSPIFAKWLSWDKYVERYGIGTAMGELDNAIDNY